MQTEVIFSYPQDFHSQIMCKGEQKNDEETRDEKQFRIQMASNSKLNQDAKD